MQTKQLKYPIATYASLFGGVYQQWLESCQMFGCEINDIISSSEFFVDATCALDVLLQDKLLYQDKLDTKLVQWYCSPVIDIIVQKFDMWPLLVSEHTPLVNWMLENHKDHTLMQLRNEFHNIVSELIIKGKIDRIKWLLDTLLNSNSFLFKYKDIVLDLCLLAEQIDIAEWFLENYYQDWKWQKHDYEYFYIKFCSQYKLKTIDWIVKKCPELDVSFLRVESLEPAMSHNNPEAFDWIMKHEEKNVPYRRLENLFTSACKSGNLDMVKFLAKNYITNVHFYQEQAFCAACFHEKFEVMKWFASEYDIYQWGNVHTPMHIAACKGRLDIIKWLIDTYKNSHNGYANNLWQEDVIGSACMRNYIDILEFMHEKYHNFQLSFDNFIRYIGMMKEDTVRWISRNYKIEPNPDKYNKLFNNMISSCNEDIAELVLEMFPMVPGNDNFLHAMGTDDSITSWMWRRFSDDIDPHYDNFKPILVAIKSSNLLTVKWYFETFPDVNFNPITRVELLDELYGPEENRTECTKYVLKRFSTKPWTTL